MKYLKNNTFSLLLLLLFPWKRIGLTHLDTAILEINPFRYSSLSKFLWNEQRIKLIIQFILKLLAFFNQIFFLLCLAQLVGDIRISSLSNFPFYALPISILLRYVLAQFLLWTEFSLRQFYVKSLSYTFEKKIWKVDDVSDRIFGRDVLASLQAVPFLVDGVYLVIAFLSSIVIIYLINGFDSTIGILTLFLFIPLSLKIASKRSHIAKQIYKIVNEKLDKINQWLDWHLYLQSWGNSSNFLSSIQKIMKSEIQLRNEDSIWRGCDLYSISFGKLVPIAVIVALSLWAYPMPSGLLTTLWLSVPIIGIIITYNRFKKEKTEGQTAFDELKHHIKDLDLKTNQSRIKVENNWEIWNGSLGDNIFEFHHEFNVLSRLHLTEEFLNLTSDPFAVELELKGKNLSYGQRIRVLLARGINLALKYNQPLDIHITFESLDSSNKKRVALCLKELAKWIPIHLATEIELISPYEEDKNLKDMPHLREYKSDSQRHAIDTDVKSSLFRDILKLCRPYFLFMLIPAIGLNLLASITVLNVSDQLRLVLLLLIGFGSFFLVLFLGRAIESYVRSWALEKGYEILKHPIGMARSDFFQRVSENYRTVCERISWYVHDGIWIASLLLFAFSTSFYVVGWVSLVVCALFFGLCVYIWNILNPTIVFTRRATIEGLNHYLTKMANVVALSTSPSLDIVKSKRMKESYEAWDSLFISQIESDATKVSFSTILYLLSGLLVVVMSCLSVYAPHYEAVMALMISAFLYVDYNIIMFFQALSGFDAQRIALHRLNIKNIETEQVLKSLFIKQDNNYLTTEFFNHLVNQKYSTYSFQSGQSYSIVGDSGTGKTLYLRCLAGMQLCKELTNSKLPRENVAYLDKHSLSIFAKIETGISEIAEKDNILMLFIDEQLRQMKRIFVFDEALAQFSLKEAKAISLKIANRIESFQGLFLLVDHRFHLDNVVPLSILSSSLKKPQS